MTRAKPAIWQVAIAAVCAGACVWSFAVGRLNEQWAGWLALFLVLELSAAVNAEAASAHTEPLPFVPATWMIGYFICGSPSSSINANMRSRLKSALASSAARFRL